MALEDFESEEPLGSLDRQKSVEQAPSSVPAPDVDEDEDLFDFPPVRTSLDTPPSPDDEATAQPVDPSAALDLDDIEEDPIAFAESILSLAHGAEQESAALGLDEDIFNFPLPGATRRPTPTPSPATLEPDHAVAPTAPRQLERMPLPPAQEWSAEAEEAGEAVEEADVARTNLRPIVALVALSLVFNTVVVVLAWRTSHSLNENVAALRTNLVSAVDAVRGERLQAAAPVEEPAESPTVHAASPALDPHPADAALQLAFARDEMADGDYPAARQRLYRMLAISDATSDPEAEQLCSRAAFLIGRAYHEQAHALRGAEEDLR